ncbi:MAG: selenocysteine-specific translation elongation factor [Pseudomonadota bacterium]
MKQIILGTAGHIDHGKTSLIKALTGINTDRLKEEQERGITIELGFASMDLPSGQRLGIVDVPGHEKFVKNMVAGATGIDIVALVVAADEGVMPQTREHMEICTLLGVEFGVVVLTKIDMVDEEMLELATADVSDFVQGTFLENAPVIPVSAVTGVGLSDFTAALDTLCRKIPERNVSGLFRLPVDRVFTMKGFGTVITGTLISGQVQVGDPVMIYPSGVTSKVRGIQVHNDTVTVAQVGQRTAINFQGLEKAAIERGEIVAKPGTLLTSFMLDISFHFLKSNKKPIKNRTRIRFHTGTSEVLGNLILLDADELAPGDDTVAQVRLDTPLAVVKDDRFVVRGYSPIRTIGGGKIMNPAPPKHKRFRAEVVAGLTALTTLGADALIGYHARLNEYAGVSFSNLILMTNLTEKQLDTALQALLSKKTVICSDKENRRYIHHDTLDGLQRIAVEQLAGYHKINPLKTGMPKEELKSKCPAAVGDKLFYLMLQQLIKDQTVVLDEDSIRLASHKVRLGGSQTELKQKILAAYQESGLTPPYFKDIASNLGMEPGEAKDVLMLLVGEEKLTKIREDLYFCSRAMGEIREKLIAFLDKFEEISMSQFKELSGVSRKYSVPLMEYFDSHHLTLRIGDIRKLRKR